MTCKGCVHYEVCLPNSQAYGHKLKPCTKYKNKADFVEVRCGEWIVEEELKTPLSKAYIRKEKTYNCPYCKKRFRQRMKFCGECGAKMDGERRADNGKL